MLERHRSLESVRSFLGLLPQRPAREPLPGPGPPVVALQGVLGVGDREARLVDELRDPDQLGEDDFLD